MTFLFQKSPGREESKSRQLDFEEFVHYLQDYEKDLKLVVKSLDKKHSGVKSLPPHYLFILFFSTFFSSLTTHTYIGSI